MLRYKKVFSRKSGSVIDQMAFALCTFSATLIYGNIASDVEFGKFSIEFSIYLVFLGIYSALITDPYSLFHRLITNKDQDVYHGWVKRLGFYSNITALVFLILLYFIMRFLQSELISLSDVLRLACINSILLYYSWQRRLAQTSSQDLEILNGTIRYIICFWLTFLCCVYFKALEHSIFLSMLFGAVFSRINLKEYSNATILDKTSQITYEQARKKHVSYAVNVVPIAVVTSVASQISIFSAAALSSIADSGALRRLVLVFMPLNQIFSIVSNLLMPKFSTTRHQSKILLKKMSADMNIFFGLSSIAYLAMVCLIVPNLGFVSTYSEILLSDILIYGCLSVVSGFSLGFAVFIRTSDNPKNIRNYGIFSSAMSLILIPACTNYFGYYGCLYSSVVVAIFNLTYLHILYNREIK